MLALVSLLYLPMIRTPGGHEFLNTKILDTESHVSLLNMHVALSEGLPGFPRQNSCLPAGLLVESELGFPRVSGHYQDPLDPARTCPHSWNRTKAGLYVDLTFWQFDREAPEIAILDPNGSVLIEDPQAFIDQGLGDYRVPMRIIKRVRASLASFH